MARGRTNWMGALAMGAIFIAVGLTTTAAATATRCALISTSGMSFGRYDPGNRRPLDSTGAVAVQCTDLTASTMISIELSRSRTGSFAPRTMAGIGTNVRVEYNLYLDAARTLIWGDGSSGTGIFRGRPLEGRALSVPIYGRIPPAQSIQGGRYDDLIIITLNY
jgi:spore coat protein U-like protein